jgi:hypothetical protein
LNGKCRMTRAAPAGMPASASKAGHSRGR